VAKVDESDKLAGMTANEKKISRISALQSGNPNSQGTINRAIMFLKRPNACVANGGHLIFAIATLWCLIYFSLNGVICCLIALTFSSTPKSLGGITVMLITLKR